MKKIITILSIIVFGVQSYLIAQSEVILYGVVLDARTEEPLIGATVQIENSTLATITDSNGAFELKRVPVGSVNITVNYLGYLTSTKTNVVVKSKGNNELTFLLKENAHELATIVVKPNPFQTLTTTPLSIQNLSAEEIKTYPGGNNDIAKVVQSLPGVGGSPGGFRNDIIIRGGAPNENVYYLDGIEIPNINHFSTQGSAGGPVGLLNVDFIDNVDLTASAFLARYDNPLSGVLQFNQRNGDARSRQTTFRIGASEAALTTEGPIKIKGAKQAKTTYLLSARRSYLQLLFQWLEIPILPDYWDYQYKINHEINESNTIYLTGVGSIDDFSVKPPKDYSALQQADLEQVPIIKQWTTTAGIGWKRRLKDGKGLMNTTFSTNILNNNFSRYEDNERQSGLLFRNESQETEYRFRTNYRRFIEDWTIEVGLNLIGATYTNETTLSDGNRTNADINMLRYGIHAQLSREFRRLGISIGLRLDDNNFTTEKNTLLKTISPRIAANYQLDETGHWNVSATVGRYFKIAPYTVLGYKDVNGNFTNKDISYTASTHFTAGITRRIGNFGKISAEGFLKLYDNYLISVEDGVSLANKGGDFSVLGNEDVTDDGKGRTYGLEILYQQKLNKHFYGIAAYTLFWSEFTDANGEYKPSVWDSRHLFSFTGGYKIDSGWEFSIRNRLTGRTPYAPVDVEASLNSYPIIQQDFSKIENQKLSVFNQLDIRIDKKWNFSRSALNIYFEAQNVLAQALPQPPVYGLNRDDEGNLISPNSLVQLPSADGTVIPTIGLVINF